MEELTERWRMGCNAFLSLPFLYISSIEVTGGFIGSSPFLCVTAYVLV
jgi:hypothetical protein